MTEKTTTVLSESSGPSNASHSSSREWGMGCMSVGWPWCPSIKKYSEFQSKKEPGRRQVIHPLHPQQGTATFPTAWTL